MRYLIAKNRLQAVQIKKWTVKIYAVFVLLAWSLSVGAQAVPYDLAKFRPVLDDSKLQAPTSSPALIDHGEFAGESNAYFYLDPTGQHMVFDVSGDSNRSELRQMSGDWQTSTALRRSLDARVRVDVPQTPSLDQYTFMQIHDTNDGLNKPLIRVVWRRTRSGMEDHLWAAIRVPADLGQPISLSNLDTDWIDLGARPDGFFDASITVHANQMRVLINGQVAIDKDVPYWDGLDNYFKAGVYLQDPGQYAVVFDELSYGLGIPGDIYGDGDIDDGDLGTSFSNYTGPVGAAGGKTLFDGDTDGDGDVDDSDLANIFGGYTGPLSPAFVPEPTPGLALMGLSAWAVCLRRPT